MDIDSDSDKLPSDVISEDELPPDVCPEPLAHSASDRHVDPNSCCKENCWQTLQDSPGLARRVTELQQALDACTKDQRKTLQFKRLKEWGIGAQTSWRRYRVWGMTLCAAAVQKLLKTTPYFLKQFNSDIAQGHDMPPRVLTETQQQRNERGAWAKASSILEWLHGQVAEDLAESVRVAGDTVHSSKPAALSKPPADTEKIGFIDELDEEGVRWMPPGTTLSEMLDLGIAFLPDQKVAYSTFVKCYHMSWEKKLKVRTVGQHSKCTACEKFKEYRRRIASKKDGDRIAAEYSSHLSDVMKDRQVDERLCAKARITAGTLAGSVKPEESLLSIVIDAMDGAKFRCPRNVSAAKEFQNLWRPEASCIGAIIEGLRETYYLCDPDISKSADVHASIIGHSLEKAKQSFQTRGKPFPRHLRLHSDNAAAEGKNQTILCLAAWLCHRRLFESVVLTQFRVGHTHSKIDQRFSELRFCLSQCCVLESPDAFMDAIREGVQPRESRHLGVERLRAAPNFKNFFQQLEVKTSGHVQTRWQTLRNEEAVHVFCFERRSEFKGEIEEVNGSPGGPQPGDVILTCRQYICNEAPSQPPFVFAYEDDFAKMPSSSNLCMAPRVALSDRQIKEFQKTAEVISQDPWNMDEGCAFLLQLMEENQSQQSDNWIPLCMPWFLSGTRADVDFTLDEPVPKLTDETFKWNHRAPAPVTVSRPPAHLKRLNVKGQAAAAGADDILPPPEGTRLERDHTEVARENPQLGLKRPAAAAAAGKRDKQRQLGRLPMPPDAKDYIGCPNNNMDIIVLDDDEDQEQHLFMEFFSPPRVAIPLRREGYWALHSFDIVTGYDFLTADGRARALKLLTQHRPFFTMLSAPCTMFSVMQNANLGKMDTATKKRRFAEANCLLDYSMLIARRQIAQKRFFAHEHPQKATSWKRQSVQDIADQEGVMKVTFDQCRVNLKTPVSEKPLQKRTTLLTNSTAIVSLFEPLQCACTEPHATIEGSEGGIQLSKWCQIYTHEFVDKLQKAVRLEWERR
ncbi:unnamed protein product [Durusdinium trenchii]|uniref:DUF7869 domain-containing protein n=1 Tax=Durusdinium trenchii TaxID=1381693 RepID=A0ABP0PT32_9DINO